MTSCQGLGVGDFNKDSKPDIVVSNSSSTAILLNGSSVANITFPNSLILTGGGSSIVVGDFDNEGDPDIYLTNRIFVNNFSSGSISSSNFSTFTYNIDGGASAYSISDFNGDGNLEINGGTTWDACYTMIINTLPISNSSLSGIGYFLSKTYAYTAGVGLGVDVDGDNKVDYISAANYYDIFSVTQNLMTPPPVITINGSLSAFQKCGTISPSTSQSFTVSGAYLTTNISIAAVSGYEFSADNINFSSTLSIPFGSGTVAATTVYVRLTAASTGTPSGNISVTSSGAATRTIALSGTVTAFPVVASQPTASVSLCENASYTLAANVTGGSSFQWYSNTTNSNSGGTSLGSANFAQTGGLQIATSVSGTYYYYMMATSNGCNVTTSVSTITISPTPIAGTAVSAATTLCSGNSTSLSLTGSSGTIQWQQSSNNSTWANVTGGAGATTANYITPNLTATTYYRAVLTSGGCTAATSNVVTVTVPAAPYPYDRAVNFTSGGYLTRETTTSLGLTNFTVEAWIYPTTFKNWAGIVSKQDFQLMTTNTGKLAIMIERGWSWEWSATATNVLNLNQWQHVAANYNASTKVAKLYVNGVLVHTFTRSQNFTPNFATGSLAVGYNNGTGNVPSYPYERNFIGNIDEVKVWNILRTDSEVATNYANQLVGNESGLVAYYKFDQGTGSANNTAITSLTDLTVNANNLTPSAMTMNGTTNNILQVGPAILSSPSMCLNSTATITHTYTGGTWSTSNAAVISIDTNTGVATANAAGSATITYTFTDNGCTYTSTKLFTVNALPTAPVATSPINLCQGATATALTATVTSGNTLQWYTVATNGTASPTAPTPITTTVANTDYYVSQKSNTTGCESPRTTITVNVNALPTISGVQALTVGGSALQLTGSGTPASSNAWVSATPAKASVSATGLVTPLASGSTIITYTNVSGCSVTATINVKDCAVPFGNALNFDGVNDYAIVDNVGNNSNLSFAGTSNFTIEAWVKRENTNGIAMIFSKYNGNVAGNYWLGIDGTGKPSLSREAQPWGVTATNPIPVNEWHHIAAIYDGSQTKIYVDGVLSNTTSAPSSITHNISNIKVNIGAGLINNNPAYLFKGDIDEIRVWNVARTATQIQQSFNSTLQGNESGLVAYYDFNQGIAGVNNASVTAVVNTVNSASNGVLTNFTKNGNTSNFVANSTANIDIAGAATICGNSTTQYTHQIPGGTWSVSNGATATISATGLLSSSINETITVSYAYTLNGCSFTATKAVAINSPAAPVTNATINLCQGITTTALTATATTGNTLQWYTVATNGTASTTAPTPSVATLGANTYFVSQKNTATNCESTRTAITVTVNAAPTISGAQSMTVGGATLQLTGTGTPDATTPWSSSNVAAATVSSTGVVTAVGPGSTIITYTADNGCTATTVISVVDCSQPFGNALQFDGVDDSFSTASNLSALSITGNITLETWIKFDQVHSDYVRIIGKGNSTNRTYGLWLDTSGKLLFQIWGNGSIFNLESNTALQPNVWYHISVTRNGNTAKIYINGTEDATSSTTINPQTNTFPLTVGYGNLHSWLKGALDEVRVWNVARSLSQIQQGMYNALVGNETGLVAYYDFNQGIAGGDNTAVNSVLDRTTNVLHGTLNNFAKSGTASNFVGNTVANFAITGAATLCANSTSQYTHQVPGGTWSVSSGANATISATGLLTAAANEDITVSYTYVVNGCSFTDTKAIAVVSPAITVQPSTTAQNVCINGVTATISVTATGSGITYQWYRNATATNAGGTLITGATNAVFMPSNTLVGTTYYYCVVSNTCSSPMTSAVSGAVTIVPASEAGTITGTTSICSGATTTLTLSGNVGSIQWQVLDSTVWTDIAGATSTTFTTPALTQNTTYRAVVTSGVCSVVNTANVDVVVNPLPVITGTTSVDAGESVTLTATTAAASSNAWVSSNPAVASVSNTGVVNGLSIGSTTIMYTNSNGCTDTEIITVVEGTTEIPALTLPATNTTGATTLNFNYTLPEMPLAGSVKLTFTPIGGGTPIVWTMNNLTSATFSYEVGTNPTSISNVVSGAMLGFTTYNVTLSYQDAFSNPASSVTNTNIQTLATPSISIPANSYNGIVNNAFTTINVTSSGGAISSFAITPNLPAGLTLNTTTGAISGTPTAALASTVFTITATNPAGTDSTTFSLFIDADTDGDGVPDSVEVLQGTNPNQPGDALDTDGDGVPDFIEEAQGTNPTTPGDALDTDGDGVPDYIEEAQGTNPTTPGDALDTDGDGVPDYIEEVQGTNPTTPGDALDTDGDGVPDFIEELQGTNPTTPGDALDTDGDGVPDFIEELQGTDPNVPGDALDTDRDGVPDFIEELQGTNPTTPGDALDTDGDGVPDFIEEAQGTNPTTPGARDTDGDGLPDYYESNNFPPTDISLTASSISENNVINAVIGNIANLDLGDVFAPTYTLVSGTGSTDNASFSIAGNQLKAGIAFDFETKSSYSIRVKTTDAGGLSFEKAFTITVSNVNETPILSVSQTTNLGVVGIPLTTITVTNTSGPATSFAITPALSAGLTFNTATGAISGTPTVAMASRTYTISGTNSDGTGTVSLTLFIDQDTDRDGLLDSIDTDDDGDGILDRNDAFPLNKNEWTDSDRDGTGDNADTDDDNDGILDGCDVDVNGDSIPDNGTDLDSDGINDGCDTDKDGDGVNNASDNCPNLPNSNQADRDRDGLGDSCDTVELDVMQALTPNGDGINDTWVIYNLGNHPGSIVRVFNSNGTQVFYSANYQNNWTGHYEGRNEMLPVGSYLYQIDLGGDGSIDSQGWLYITK